MQIKKKKDLIHKFLCSIAISDLFLAFMWFSKSMFEYMSHCHHSEVFYTLNLHKATHSAV